MVVEPNRQFPGTIIIVAPHMDDELLACGGTVALLAHKERIHAIYATDGMKSPSPIIPGRDQITPDLGQVRMRESMAAMGMLGVPEQNLHFLCLPEAELKAYLPALRRGLLETIAKIQPDYIFMPFRYDRHLDHLAINHVLSQAREQGTIKAQLVEYFVYYRWRLLPLKDVRQYIRPHYLLEVDTQTVAAQKRAALDCFASQTTKYYPWQTRPILTPVLLDDTSYTPELFVMYDSATRGVRIFAHTVGWIRIVHRLEPFLQRWKYLLGATLRRALGKNKNAK